MSIRFGAVPSSDAPSARIPVPESRITRLPSSGRTSTHDVFPPVRTVSGPGDAERAPRAPEPGAHVRPPRPAPRRRRVRRRADPPVRTAGCRRPRGTRVCPSTASIRRRPWLGIPVLNAAASGRSSSRSGSPASSTGLNALASSARAHLRLGVRAVPRMRSAGSLKKTRLPVGVDQEHGVARFAARSFARIRAMCRCFGGAGSVTIATVHHEARSRRRYPRTWRRLGSWWAPRSSKPTRGRRALWRVRFPSASAERCISLCCLEDVSGPPDGHRSRE